eukprot:8374396-Alexandrium_andersonii.AAC.1
MSAVCNRHIARRWPWGGERRRRAPPTQKAHNSGRGAQPHTREVGQELPERFPCAAMPPQELL